MKTSGSSRRELEIVSSIAEALNSAPSVQEALERTLELADATHAALFGGFEVTVPLPSGHNVLKLSVDGQLPTRVATDSDRLVLQVP